MADAPPDRPRGGTAGPLAGRDRTTTRRAGRDRTTGRRPGLVADRRGVTPAVGKTLEIGLAVLFVALVTTVLLAGVVPEYRAATGQELGERALVTASQEVEAAVPPNGTSVTVRRSVDLPDAIAGSAYDVRVDGRALVLDHPDDGIDGRVRLVLPSRVDRVDGHWQSGAETAVVVEETGDRVVVELTNGGSSP